MDATPPTASGRYQQLAPQPHQQQQNTQQSDATPQLNTLDKQDSEKTSLQQQWATPSKLTGPPHLRVRQAIRDGDPKALAAALADGGPNLVNAIDPETKMTPLMMAVESGSLEIVDLLLSTDGIRVNDQMEDGRTALHLACEQGESLILEALLKKGAHPDTVARFKDTPLIAACDSGQLNCVILLVDHLSKKHTSKAHLNHQDQDGMTALSSAADWGHPYVVDFLIRSGSEVNVQDNKGWTLAFHIANSPMPAAEKIRLLKLAEKHGADLYYHSPDGTNLFSIALEKDDAETLSDVLSKGIKNLKNQDPLIQAAESGWQNSCHCLLKHKFKFEVRDRHGFTPLMHAAQNGHWEIAEMLMCAGATLSHHNDLGQTALDLAALHGHGTVAERLLQHSDPVLHLSPETLKTLLALAVKSETWGITDFLRKKVLYDSHTGQLLSVDDYLPSVANEPAQKTWPHQS